MPGEAAYLAAALGAGAYIVWVVVEVFARRHHVALTAASMAAFAHGTQPALVYPHTDLVLGVDWLRLMTGALRRNAVLETWHDLFTRTVGHTFWHLSIGSWMLMTNEPDNVKALLSTQFDAWPIGGTRQKTTELALGPHAIFSANGAEWAAARALIRPSFVRNQIADLECTDAHVEAFLSRLPRDGASSKVDLQALLYMFTMDTSTDFMFGYSTDMLVNPTAEAVKFTQSFEYALLSSASRARLGWLLLLLPDRKLAASVAYCKSYIDGYVAEALRRGKSRDRPYVFMNEMLDSGASHSQITEQLLAMILGGRDTSASTMSSMFWELARRPEVVRRLRAEVASLEGRRPTWEELKGLKYLNNVLKEALRLWAPVVTNMRTANRDTVLPRGGGPDGQAPLFVPKGTSVRFVLYSLHRRKDVYGDDAEEFRPERWDNLRMSWEYVPFSGGPRICIGQQFALTMMSYLTARFFQVYESIEAADDEPMVQQASTTISLVNGCWVKLTPTPPARRNGRFRGDSRDRSWSRPRGRDSRDRSLSPLPAGTKIVVERLSKNIHEGHLREIFGRYGRILDLDLPMNRTFNTNRGTAYIMFERQDDAEVAIASMHEGEIDGAIVNVSIVLPRSLMATDPPLVSRGANMGPRDRRTSYGYQPAGGYGNDRRPSPGYPGPRGNAYRDPSPRGPPRGGNRYRSRSYDSYSSRSRSKSAHRGGGGRYDDDVDRRRSPSPAHQSHASYDRRGPPTGPRHDYR
ncbi:molybdenum cofactor synthesis protein 2B [Purpureocillium lavendulum]|uniref:Molybdenum cofactor synthesis protein 2B n=1 Tax=Purpureocillium lavendulum TaxID=1247861 RepID=A0AB34G7A4_9HYPO|nr:molybdenum cofactor synthesis protein 2B [Purpureocillium lavendulum]